MSDFYIDGTVILVADMRYVTSLEAAQMFWKYLGIVAQADMDFFVVNVWCLLSLLTMSL